MTESLRDQIAGRFRDARRASARFVSRAPTSLTDADFDAADELLASFDIRPHNEPADPQDVAAFLFEVLRSTSGDVRDLPLLAELNAYLDRRDVGGDSPAEETT